MSVRCLITSALVAGISTIAMAQTPSPATKRAREVVAVINSATPATIRAFVDSAFDDQMRGLPMRAHIDFFMGQREQSGGTGVGRGAGGEAGPKRPRCSGESSPASSSPSWCGPTRQRRIGSAGSASVRRGPRSPRRRRASPPTPS